MTEQRYALLIGNNEFQENSGIDALRCPPQDVQGLAAVLADSERGQFQVMPPLINKTRQEIEVGLFNILKKATKNDVVLIYFSGHGIPTNLKKQLYLSAKDTQVDALQVTAIAVSQIKELIDESYCNRIILILDCCFSGAIDKVFLKKGELSSQVNQTLAELSKDEGGGLHIMTASTANQTAVEKEGDLYSVFTKHLINGIATGDADKHTQGVIKLSELFAYVKEQVKTESTQTPQIFTLGGGDLLIAHSGKSPRNDRFSKIRTLLLDLLHHGQLDDKVYLEAINILNSPIEQLSELEKNRDSLLTELYAQKIGSVEFIGKWAVAGIVAKPDEPIKKPPPEIKKPEPVKPVEIIEKTVKATPKLANVQPEKVIGIKNRFVYVLGIVLLAIVVAMVGLKFYLENKKTILLSPEPIPVVTPKQVAKPTPEQQAATAEKIAVQKNKAIEPEMVAIKGGCFMMGSPNTEKERASDEKQHKVCVEDFSIGKYEVTQAQWQAVMGKNPSNFKGDNLPIEQVSYNDVQDFINKLNTQTGQSYRLPTEAEWEYAARAGTTTAFYTGDCINTQQANYDGTVDYNNCGAKTGVYKQTTVAVGSYPANPWGLYDMAGNVWEWTCSAYVENYDGSEKQCVSKNDATSSRVLRGGSWFIDARGTRSADRLDGSPDSRGSYFGFRFALGQTAS